MGNLFSANEKEIQSNPSLYLSTSDSERFALQLGATLITSIPWYQKMLSTADDSSLWARQVYRDFDLLIAESRSYLRGARGFETRKKLLVRAIPSDGSMQGLRDYLRTVTPDDAPTKGQRSDSGLDIDIRQMVSLWFENDADLSGTLDAFELKELFSSIGIEMGEKDLQRKLKKYLKTKKALNFDDFFKMYMEETTVAAIETLFRYYQTTPTRENAISSLSVYEVCRFLRADQHMIFHNAASERVAAAIFGELRPRISHGNVSGVTYRQFQKVMLSDKANGWVNPFCGRVWQDMSQPLTHYFIDSSHNTYAAGHQYHGKASCEMYKKALRSGCRCVEIDCWDGDNGQPKVTHGHTLMTAISFKDVIMTIADHAFTKSPYPIILSLELHCSPPQQEKMVDILEAVFGSKIVTAAEIEATDLYDPFFTPMGLMHRILIKCKKFEANEEDDEDDDDAVFIDKELDADGNAKGSIMKGTIPRLSRLASNQAMKCKGKIAWKSLRDDFKHYNVVSFDEDAINKYAKIHHMYAEQTKDAFIRVYPKAARVASGNYNPTAAWSCGAQLVALNIQTFDHDLRLNRAKFMVNGSCGYVLKPRCMRVPGVDARSFQDRAELTVRIISATNLSGSNNETVSPFIELFVEGDGLDNSEHLNTSVIINNGFNPQWNEEFSFSVNAIEMAFLTLRVRHRGFTGDVDVGDNSIALESLRQGYRSLRLMDRDGKAFGESTVLFCHFSLCTKHEVAYDDV